ncbi:hypothetical protein YC2023_098186 [Brassica napus]
MGTVDPPDLPLSPTKVGSSLGEAQGSDRLMKNDGEFTEVLDVTKSLGIKDSEMVGSSDLSLKALNQKHTHAHIVIMSARNKTHLPQLRVVSIEGTHAFEKK